jgi:hypothetical protein
MKGVELADRGVGVVGRLAVDCFREDEHIY